MHYQKKENNSRILVVDDEEDVLDFLRIFLTSLGWEVTAVSTIDQAFNALEHRAYFMVLTDVAMPEMDGYEFIGKIRDKRIPSEVALMTGFGYNPKHTLVKIHKTMRYPFYFKPFNRVKIAEGAQNAWAHYHRSVFCPEAET